MAANLAKGESITILRRLIKELRLLKPGTSPRNYLAYDYILDKYKENRVTQEQVCRANNAMVHNAQTYLCLLQSTRELEELNAIYQKGEKTIEASARQVGLELPPQPAPWNDGK